MVRLSKSIYQIHCDNINKLAIQLSSPQDVILKQTICTTVHAIDPVEILTVLLDTVYVGRSKMGLQVTTRVG